ncbi:MAG: TolC family protein, partial [Myxococcales bacterium]|nr:TolC family protein [Myxococcales bacterium]
DAEIESSEEDLRDVLVSLLAEVARDYVDLRTFRSRVTIAQRNLETQRETLDIAQWRAKAGLATDLDVEQARYALEQTRSQIPTLRQGAETAAHALAVLLGRPPGAIPELAEATGPMPAPPETIAVGVPADTLRRRPDVRRAERAAAAQNAQIGVAKADWYPKFTLLGSIGLDSTKAGSLFTKGSWDYGIGPKMTWNLFDAGRIRGNVEAQEALEEQSLLQYRSAVLQALQEVEDALVAYVQERDRRGSLDAGTEAARRAVGLARDQYASGLIDFQTVLAAERALLTLEDQRAASAGRLVANVIGLYKALGGGWTSEGAEDVEDVEDADGVGAMKEMETR